MIRRLDAIWDIAEEQKGSEKMGKYEVTISLERYDELLHKEAVFDRYAYHVERDQYASDFEKNLFCVLAKCEEDTAEGDDF